MASQKEIPQWERVQKKTFTKWVNVHLKREWGPDGCVEDVVTSWESGLSLMKLAVALFKENEKHPEQRISMPKLKAREKEPKSKIQKITNLNTAISLFKTAGVSMRGISAENFHDHEDKDKAVIMGCIFTIILDYAARGFGAGSSSEVKRALLQWVNKKTDGYAQVNPPGVKNFTKDWRNGLAWCALIHRHRPDLLDYQECLGKSNAENLALAFTVADEQLGIPRLLDVEDMDVDSPDEKSVITYTMEYFLRFANAGLREQAAKQAADWLSFLREIKDLQHDYERRARIVIGWTGDTTAAWAGYDFGSTKEEAVAAFNNLRAFVTTEKPPQEGERLDLEALFAEIQTTLQVNGLRAYVPPDQLTPDALEDAFTAVADAQRAFGQAVREARFQYSEKKEDKSGEEVEAQIEESFRKYDTNNSNSLNRQEFNAACMEMGIALQTDAEKDALFGKISEGAEELSYDQFKGFMLKRLVVSLDDPESIKNAFKTLADGGGGLTEAQLGTRPITDEDKAFLMDNMPKNAAGLYDFNAFVDLVMESE